MARDNQPAMRTPANPSSLKSVTYAVLRHRGVQSVAALWVLAYVIVLWLAQGSLPFDRPALASLPFALQVTAPCIGLVEIVVLMALTFLVTRRRTIPDMAGRAPERRQAVRETAGVLIYATLGQMGGWLLGPALGFRPFSFHIAGTVFGCSVTPLPMEVAVWALYNGVIFALIPLLYFRRHYPNADLNLTSNNRANDAGLILVVLLIESAFEFFAFDTTVFNLNIHQALIGAPLTLALYFVGTVLPTMVLIYAILLPRYLKLTGSAISTALLGGVSYAAMHIVEGWSVFDSPADSTLSLLFVLLTYVGPGMMKSVLTLRTGNAWVHAISYHAIAPHLMIDSPLIVKVFHIA